MKKKIFNLTLSIFCLALFLSKINMDKLQTFVGKELKNDKIVVCIDPGHQEKGDSNLEPIAPGSSRKKARVSSGATGVATKKPEYVLNLETSMILRDMLEEKGYEIIMTRETHDVNISNTERAILANEKNADIVIRIHADSLNDSSKTGASILCPAKNDYTGPIYEESERMAKIIKDNMSNMGIKVNGVFERDDITGFNWSKVPVVIVEMGFLSNYNEDLLMSDVNYQKKLMQSISNSVDQYFK